VTNLFKLLSEDNALVSFLGGVCTRGSTAPATGDLGAPRGVDNTSHRSGAPGDSAGRRLDWRRYARWYAGRVPGSFGHITKSTATAARLSGGGKPVARPEIRNVVSPETAAWSVTSRQHIWSVQRGQLRIPKQAMNSFFTRED
jgi:hypothetical protein